MAGFTVLEELPEDESEWEDAGIGDPPWLFLLHCMAYPGRFIERLPIVATKPFGTGIESRESDRMKRAVVLNGKELTSRELSDCFAGMKLLTSDVYRCGSEFEPSSRCRGV